MLVYRPLNLIMELGLVPNPLHIQLNPQLHIQNIHTIYISSLHLSVEIRLCNSD